MAQLDLLTPATPPAPPATNVHIDDIPLPQKADGAYKTIREVSEEIDVPQHVLRFWESRFPQIKPSRMRGSRRYYRPEDIETIKTIKTLLYSKGYTIKGAKKVVSGKEPLPAAAPRTAPVTPQAAAAPRQAAPQVPQKKPVEQNIDVRSLVSELRVLKSMLTSLL
jgi:DNA-binding transcriptional MerR regulator